MFNPFRKKSKESIEIHDISDLFDKESHWYEEAYWAVYRFFRWSPIVHPKRMYREVKWFIQRGKRGWADRDIWCLDGYLDELLVPALTRLKKHKHGIPMDMFEEIDGTDETGNPSNTASERAKIRWDKTLDKMIEGFRASKRMSEAIYEDELGAYPLRRAPGQTKEEYKKVIRDRIAQARVLAERDDVIRLEGMTLFVKHYHSLWD